MTVVPRSGELEVREGSLYWQYDGAVGVAQPTTIVFVHAAVANNELWDDQVAYLTSRGWNCLRYDLFGFNLSRPSKQFLESQPRPKVDHLDHLHQLVTTLVPDAGKVVVVGLSMGGGYAAEYALKYPETVAGLAVVAGGVSDFDCQSLPQEDALFAEEGRLLQVKDTEALADLEVRIWGDGPLQAPGRLNPLIAAKMRKWCLDIAKDQCANTGGPIFETTELDPPALSRTDEFRFPTAIAYGTYDEKYTTEAMKFLAKNVAGAASREFKTGHMVNLEVPDEFNSWLGGWLYAYFSRYAAIPMH